MNISITCKMFRSIVIWYVGKLWIRFSEFFKNSSLNQHKACTNFKNFNWFSYLNFTCSRNWIKNKITSILFKSIRLFISMTRINSITHLLPSNTFLRIRSTNNFFVQCSESQYIIRIESNIAINKH